MGGVILALASGFIGYKLAEHHLANDKPGHASRWTGSAWHDRCDERRAERAAFKEFLEQRYKQAQQQGQQVNQPASQGLDLNVGQNEKDTFASWRQDAAASALDTAERTLETVLQQVRAYKNDEQQRVFPIPSSPTPAQRTV